APVHRVLRVCSQTWNITATSVIWEPKPEKTRPSQSRRNGGEVRSGVRSTRARVRGMAGSRTNPNSTYVFLGRSATPKDVLSPGQLRRRRRRLPGHRGDQVGRPQNSITQQGSAVLRPRRREHEPG